MKISIKSLYYFILFTTFHLASCSGPTDKQPEVAEKQELQAKTDSLEQQPKDGTDVESDSMGDQ